MRSYFDNVINKHHEYVYVNNNNNNNGSNKNNNNNKEITFYVNSKVLGNTQRQHKQNISQHITISSV